MEKARTIFARYKHIIARCDEIAHGFSKRGILALVDDATGYQDDKMRQEIDRIIKAYVAPTLTLNRRAKLWQQLTVDTGIPHLDRQLTADLTLMGISENREQFDQHWKKLFGRQPKLPFGTQKELGARYLVPLRSSQ